jgi:hypothetical protein
MVISLVISNKNGGQTKEKEIKTRDYEQQAHKGN